jgi:large conductance mechanosensitive channel
MSGFRKFLLRGNVVELAVAVVIGGAFTLIVNSFVEDIMNPLIAATIGTPNFSELTVDVGDASITYGNFLNAVVTFVLVAAVVYFLVVKPYERLAARFKPVPEVTTRDCPECLSAVPVGARRCAHCTSELTPV